MSCVSFEDHCAAIHDLMPDIPILADAGLKPSLGVCICRSRVSFTDLKPAQKLARRVGLQSIQTGRSGSNDSNASFNQRCTCCLRHRSQQQRSFRLSKATAAEADGKVLAPACFLGYATALLFDSPPNVAVASLNAQRSWNKTEYLNGLQAREDAQERKFVHALLLAWFGAQNRSLFASRCLVETATEMYQQGLWLKDLQLALSYASESPPRLLRLDTKAA